MNKDAFEQACRKTGLTPARRVTIRGRDVFVADGFCPQPDVMLKRFGVVRGEYPNGVYATIWFAAKDEQVDIGHPIFFDPMHNPEYDLQTKKMARVNTAINDASDTMRKLEEMVGNA